MDMDVKKRKEKCKQLLVCDEHTLHKGALFAAIAYVIVLFWALWLKFNDFDMVVPNYYWLSTLTVKERFLYDIIPFQIRFDFWNQFIQFPANAVVFAPFGVLLNHLFPKKNVLRDLAICFGVSLSIEVVQLFTMIGGFATADLIMNTLGYFIGYALYRWVFSKLSTQTMVWIYRVANLLLLVILIVAAITTVSNWELITAILTRTL
jgi:glycopeptide antibiotics resistance protein